MSPETSLPATPGPDDASDSLYSDSAYYRMLFRERLHDVPFYLAATERCVSGDPLGEVLELGVGDGRVAFALAREGRHVHGVDASASMLEALEERRGGEAPEVAPRVHAHQGDSRSVRLGRSFGAVLCPFNGLAHFHDAASLAALFSTVRAHLAPGGLFAFDVLIPDPGLLTGGGSSVPWLVHPRTGAVCRLEETYAYEPLTQVLTVTTHLIERETAARQTLSLRLRQLFPEETRLLLAHHGFEILGRDETLGDALGYRCRALP